MTPSDARARYLRMRGYNVMFPIGFDAFGLPAENAAIQRNIHPKKWTYANIEHMRKQLRTMGAMWDWEREAVSCDPEYYRWTQWFFVQFFKHGLAYKKMAAVDWCPHCNTTLAREQVWGDDRHCERCETPVIKKDLEQWFFRITNYADELLDFAGIDWPERVQGHADELDRPQRGRRGDLPDRGRRSDSRSSPRGPTRCGARPSWCWRPSTRWWPELTTPAQPPRWKPIASRRARQTDIEREATEKEKTGVFTGGYAINPVKRRAHPHLDRRLRADDLRHRRHHGRARRTTSATSPSPGSSGWRCGR